MCKVDGETTDDLLLHCPVALRALEHGIFSFGVHWVMPKGVVEILASWQGKFGRCSNVVIWSVIPYCLMWGIWQERNAKNLEGCEKSVHDLKLLFSRLYSSG